MKKNVSKKFIVSSLAFAVVALASIVVFAIQLPLIFPFDREEALKKWKEKVFRGKVLYVVEVKDSGGYLSAHSEQAASGIFYRLVFSPRKKPLISWQWRVTTFPEKPQPQEEEEKDSKKGWIERDDYAARFYVIFPGLSFSGTRCLEYVWDKDLPADQILTSPYFHNIKIVVAESGNKNLGKWVKEVRNIREDYRRAFGLEPPKVGALAIMTDADDSLSSAEAHYRDIKVGYEEDGKE